MSTVTLQQLLDCDPSTFDAAADAWTALGGGLDDAAEQFIRGSCDLENVWSEGADAQAAVRQNVQLRARISNAVAPARRTGEALRVLAGTLRGLKSLAWQALADAQRNGYQIDCATGQVTRVAPVPEGASADQVRLAVQNREDEVRSLLERARAADDEAVRRIAAERPDQAIGFGTASARRLTEDEVRNQRGKDPKDVNAWWEGLTPEQQEQAIRDYPELVGWLDGVPIDDRDAANRIVLDRRIDDLTQRQKALDEREAYVRSMIDQGRGEDLYPGVANQLNAALDELERIETERRENRTKLGGLNAIDARLNNPNQPGAYLVALSTDGNGKAIVSIGNPDTADNVATYVPGTGSKLKPGLHGDLVRADSMADDALAAAPGERTAVVLWLGYDAPQSIAPDAMKEGYADRAAPDLRRFQDGLRVTHDGPPAHQTVLGHSYGTTVVGHAASGGSLNADSVVFVASPGVGVDHASDLRLTPYPSAAGHVYATTAEHDIIGKAGSPKQLATELAAELVPGLDNRIGSDPSDPRYLIHGQSPVHSDFGATVFASDPGSGMHPLDTHSQYWEDGNVARKGMAKIIVGDGVSLRQPAPGSGQTPSPAPGPAPTPPRTAGSH